MSARRKATNVRSCDSDNTIRILDDGTHRIHHEPHVPNLLKKTSIPKKASKNSGFPSGYKVDDLPPDVIDQFNHQYIPPQYPMMDQTSSANVVQPMLIDQTNHPFNMALYQGAPCWCSQHSNEMRAIRELVTGISNGIHCILQKIHMDQIQNANMMARIMNTVEMVADTVTNLPIAQFQEYDQYLLDEIPAENATASPDGLDTGEPYYTQSDEQTESDQHPTSSNYRCH